MDRWRDVRPWMRGLSFGDLLLVVFSVVLEDSFMRFGGLSSAIVVLLGLE